MQAMGDSAKEPEQTLQSFASLLSSAVTTGGVVPLTGCPSAISCFLSHVDSNTTCVSIPSLSLKNRSAMKTPAAFGSSKQNLEDSAAFSLSTPLLCTKEDVVAAPALVLQNVLESFESLINSRLKSSLTALVRQTLHNQKMSRILKKTDDNVELAARQAKTILNLFSSSVKAISINTVVTSFRVLPMDDDRDFSSNCSDLIMPLVFEAIVDVKILGQLVTVALRAPGTITGSFRPSDANGNAGTNEGGSGGGNSSCLTCVQIAFDTSSLLKAMMKQARLIVKKAMLAASSVASLLASDSGKQLLMEPPASTMETASPTKQPSQQTHASRNSEESSAAKTNDYDGTDAPLKAPPSSASTDGGDSASFRRPTLSRIDSDENPIGAVPTRPASCPLMPPPPPRPPSCGSNISSTSSNGLCSLSEAATLVQDKANASFSDLQSQSSVSSSFEEARGSRHRTTPVVSLENLSGQTRLERKSGKKRSRPSGPKRYSSSGWEKKQDSNGKSNQEWRTGTPTVSSDDLLMLSHKKRRRASCPQ